MGCPHSSDIPGIFLFSWTKVLLCKTVFFKLFQNGDKIYLLIFDNGSSYSCFISANLETISRKDVKSFVTFMLYSCKASLKSSGRSSRNTYRLDMFRKMCLDSLTTQS